MPVSLRCPGVTAEDLLRFGMGLGAVRPAQHARIGQWVMRSSCLGAFEIMTDSSEGNHHCV